MKWISLLLLLSATALTAQESIEFIPQVGVGEAVLEAEFSPSGKYLSAFGGKQCVIYNIKSGLEQLHFKSKSDIRAVRFLTDQVFIVANSTGKVEKRNISTGKVLMTFVVNGDIFDVEKSNTNIDEILVASDSLYEINVSTNKQKIVLNQPVLRIKAFDTFYNCIVKEKSSFDHAKLSNTYLKTEQFPVGKIKFELNRATKERLPILVAEKPKYTYNQNTLIKTVGDKIDIYDLQKKKMVLSEATYYLKEGFTSSAIADSSNKILVTTKEHRLYEYDLKKLKYSKLHATPHLSRINSISFSTDEQFFATGGNDYSIIIWNTKTITPIKRLYSKSFRTSAIKSNSKGNQLLVGNMFGNIIELDFDNEQVLKNAYNASNSSISTLFLSEEKDSVFYFYNTDGLVKMKSDGTKEVDETFYYQGQFSGNRNNYIYSNRTVYEINDGEEPSTSGFYIDELGRHVYYFAVSDNGLSAALVPQDNFSTGITSIRIGTRSNRHPEASFVYEGGISFPGQVHHVSWVDSMHLAYVFENKLWIVNKHVILERTPDSFPESKYKKLLRKYIAQTDQEEHNNFHKIISASMAHPKELVSSVEKYLFDNKREKLACLHEDELTIYDTDKYQQLIKLNIGVGVVDFAFKASDGIYCCYADGSIKLWSLTEGKMILNFLPVGSKNLIILDDSGHYMSANNNIDGVGFKANGQVYPPEQFDIIFNRPDLVLSKLYPKDHPMIIAYHKAYLKRLKKMNFTEDMLKEDFHLPEIKIKNIDNIASVNSTGKVELELLATDSSYKLDRVNIWVNDVAIYGSMGISLRENNLQNYSSNISVDLAHGKNKIQVSVLNQSGAESYKENIEILCTGGKIKPNLYILTIGVSEFSDPKYNLNFAAKDAGDIVNQLTKSSAFENVYSKTLVNDQVTKANVIALKSFLEKADIDDQVMVFVAGHGVLDANLDYFFATHNMDFSNPAKDGLAYEDLEGLLDGIAPLKKTLLIDACHSGEIDKDEVELVSVSTEESDDIQFRAVGNTVESKLGATNTIALTKSLFTDLRKGTGATVISAAGGMEFAMESENWKNGLFTYALLNGIQSGDADLNNDGEIWLSEIQMYVQNKVLELSGGKQQPTSRIENKALDYRIW